MSHLEFYLSEEHMFIHVAVNQQRVIIVHDLNTLQNFHLDVGELMTIALSMMEQPAVNYPDDYAPGGQFNPIIVDDYGEPPVDSSLESEDEE